MGQYAGAYGRLPRTRGDRPFPSNNPHCLSSAPPHTRGSTPRSAAPSSPRRGSPAHAGIDPHRPRPRRPDAGLPRTRGDRPAGHHPPGAHRPAPPHTRGSTRARPPAPSLGLGSPAHAGIDPSWGASAAICPRLPRTRGDRPQHHEPLSPCALAPPHTRGSTLPAGRRVRPADGSPAHAGIDPRWLRQRMALVRLPRTRGDRPNGMIGRYMGQSAPPHTRGSTCASDSSRACRFGSPAHAGIDPQQRTR